MTDKRSNSIINIAIVDDHKIFCDCIQETIQKVKSFNVLKSYTCGMTFIRDLESNVLKPDILILDISLSEGDLNGMEILKFVKYNFNEIKVIILSSHFEINLIKQFINLGASSYIKKDFGIEELITTIKEVYKHGEYLDIIKKHESKSNEKISEEFRKKISAHYKNQFSNIEVEILKLLCKGLKNEEIATSIGKSVKTVDYHRSLMMQKAEAKNFNELVYYAFEHRINLK